MRKLIIATILFLFAFNVQAQWYNRKYGVESLNDLNENQLTLVLQQTQKKIKTGKLLTGAGIGCAVAGGYLVNTNFCIFSCSKKENTLVSIGTILLIGGFSSVVVGIPKWAVNAHRKNKIEFALVRINNPALRENNQSAFGKITAFSAPGLSLRIHF